MSKVYVSVGHGRKSSGVMDPGATTADGSKSEQSEGSPIARACAARLRDLGVTVRLNDKGGPDFAGGARAANSWGADVAVEIHHDWNRAPRGCFGFWWPGSSQGQKLANRMRDAIVGQLNYPHRFGDHRGRNLAWVRMTAMPAVLWECDRIGTVSNHRAYGRAMADGIAAYLGVSTGGGSGGSGGGGSSDPEPGTDAPPYPLPSGHYFGPRSGPVSSVSGYYSHREDLRTWQDRMADRGWTIAADGYYGPQTRGVATAFQREKSLSVDGLIGPETWDAAWTEPIT